MKTDTPVDLSLVRDLKPSGRNYPKRILELPGRARVIRILGDLDVLEMGPALAVIGTRDPSPEVIETTRRVVAAAADFQMVIVSGLSPGVDVQAHEAALDTGLRTIAIPGCGLGPLMDSDRGDLASRILDAGGLLLSPFPMNSPETAERRWWRNRIVAAVCHGLMVVASEPEGGAWEAHRWARQLERRLIEPSESE